MNTLFNDELHSFLAWLLSKSTNGEQKLGSVVPGGLYHHHSVCFDSPYLAPSRTGWIGGACSRRPLVSPSHTRASEATNDDEEQRKKLRRSPHARSCECVRTFQGLRSLENSLRCEVEGRWVRIGCAGLEEKRATHLEGCSKLTEDKQGIWLDQQNVYY